MFELFFSIIWLAISLPIFSIIIFSGELGFFVTLITIPFAILFIGIGIFILIKGLKKIKINNQTNELGIETYGLVIDIQPAGVGEVNGKPIMTAHIIAYNLNTQEVTFFEEELKLNEGYKKGTYVKVKIYKNDLNIITQISDSEVPRNIAIKILEAKSDMDTEQNITPLNSKPTILRCPNCGALITSNIPYCKYCDAKLI